MATWRCVLERIGCFGITTILDLALTGAYQQHFMLMGNESDWGWLDACCPFYGVGIQVWPMMRRES